MIAVDKAKGFFLSLFSYFQRRKVDEPVEKVSIKIGDQRRELRLDTRKGNHIANVLDESPPIDGMLDEARSFREKFRDAGHRDTQPTRAYNCHGLTFASRRTAIVNVAELRKLLKEDGYVSVQFNEVRGGDIVLYLGKGGDVLHSGIVTRKEDLGLRILSKWGGAHEVVHMQGDTPYQSQTVSFEYWRIVK